MIKSFFTFCTLLLCLCSRGQVQLPRAIDTTRQSITYWEGWLRDLNTSGARQDKDSFKVEAEVVRLMKDEAYRKSVYPTAYNWQATVGLLQAMELKKAFWHLLNLYMEDKKNQPLVLRTLFTYDSVFAMDQVLVSSFYTYAFTDPRLYRFANGKADIYRPDLLEKHLAVTREICEQIWAYRKKKGLQKAR